jgi:hypothetical protein
VLFLGLLEGIELYERIARESPDAFARYEARLVLEKLYAQQREIEIEEEAEEIRRIEEAEVEEPIPTESERLYRYSYAIVFSYHGEYYSVVAQGWSTEYQDPDTEELVKQEVIDRYEEACGNYSMDEMLGHGASAEIDHAWEEVRYDQRLVGKIEGRTEFRSRKTFQRWVRKGLEKWGF